MRLKIFFDMSTNGTKKPCAKCSKGAGVTTCDGCQQCFCTKHFVEHREELSQRMDLIREDQQRFQRETTSINVKEVSKHPFLTKIDSWERESIAKIQLAAETSRNQLRQLLDRTKIDLKLSIDKINDELEKSRQTEDFTENDLKRWTEQLKDLRQRLETPPTIVMNYDEDSNSTIRLLKISERTTLAGRSSTSLIRPIENRFQPTKETFNVVTQEKFVEVDGKATISDDGLSVTGGLASILTQPIIYGTNRYSTGKHQIRFRIEKMAEARLFFGIIRSLENVSRSGQTQNHHNNNNNSLYGWWDLNETIVNGRVQTTKYRSIVSTGDELIFTIDCEAKQIQLQHQRTKRLAQLDVNLDKCPLPWKLVIRLQSAGDCVRIVQ